jgi:CMP-N,N'-diacetyllegionaminic acid synthase
MKTPKISALLTGRGNNTLSDKNILPVFGRPLLQYPALEAKKVELISNFWVSSDCDKILSAAGEVGYEIIRRPEKFAKPDSQHVDVIDHALAVMKDNNDEPDILVVLLANTVTVKTKWISDCIDVIINDNEITACVPVYKEMDHHPFRAKKINTNGLLEPFFDFTGKKISTNRQDLEPSYFLCHNYWVLNLNQIKREIGQPPWVFMGNKVAPYEVDEAFDVHTTEDLIKSEKWLKKHNII